MSDLRVVRTKAEVREALAAIRRAGEHVALVPTMGYLHAGHLSLLDRARESAGCVALSIFVNPLQFSPSEDLDRYPRDLERDIVLAAERGADLLFAPSAAEMYPHGEPWAAVVPERGADRLCGAARPGHFRGVLTVVAKLFGIFTPDAAIFGQKDYQQATLIRWMAAELEIPVRIEIAPIVREEGGLAMSSRNSYLSNAERERALSLWRSLDKARVLFDAGEADAEVLRHAMRRTLSAAGVEVEYADLVDPHSLEPLTHARAGAVCAVAGWVGETRLIDNIILAG